MRVESISPMDRVANIKPIEIQESENRSAINKSGYLKELPKNFKTLDPKSHESTVIGELELIEAIEKANKTLKAANTNFQYSIHEDTRAIMVKVINSETDEVIREIPPEKVLDMVAKMWEVAGLLVDRQI